MRQFIKTVFATVVGLMLFSILGLGGLLVLVGAIATLGSQSEAPRVEDKTVLSFNLSQNISDTSPEVSLGDALVGQGQEDVLPLRQAINAIEAAAKDDRIAGLYLSGSIGPGGNAGFANLRELRQALQTFRQSGKPILSYNLDWSERDYYLTSVANTVMLNPAGGLEVNGLRSEMMFFAGALEKFGVGVQVVRVGRYKAGGEMFTRSDRSPEDRQQTQQLLSDLWSEFLSTTAQSRKLTPQRVQAIADGQGLLLPDQAKTAGLVDRVAYPDEVLAELHKLTGEDKTEDSFRQISLSEYAELAADELTPSGSQEIALVYLDGDIVSGNGGPGSIGGDRIARLLRKLRTDQDVKAIVLRINSPGGSATASDVVAREVLLTRKAKPVIVSMGSVAASGGYQIAANATQIFASPNTITGSIGVYGIIPNFQRIANNNGITWDVVKTGRFADMDTIARPLTPEELAMQQRITERFYQNFLNTVAAGRPISPQQVAEVAQGRVWSGTDAKQVGLVDQLGGLEAAIAAAAQAAKLENDWYLEEYPKTRSLEERLVERFFSHFRSSMPPSTDPLTLQVQRLQSELRILQTLNDPMHLYSRLLFDPRIQ